MNPVGMTYRLIATLLAGLMLISTLNLSIDMHYCNGELKSVAFFDKAQSCHKPAQKRVCPNHPPQKEQNESAYQKNCCQNKGFFIKADIDEQVPGQEESVENQNSSSFVALAPVFSQMNLKSDAWPPVYKQYKPPLIKKDIPVLFESYLL